MDADDNKFGAAPFGPPIRVLFVITQSEVGGAQQFLARLVSRLSRKEFDPIVIAGDQGIHAIKSLLPPEVAYHSAKYLQRSPDLFNDLRAVAELKQIILQYQPQILFLNSSKAGFVGALATRLIKDKLPNMAVIYRIGGWTFNDPWPFWQKYFYICLEKISAPWKDYIIVNSQKDFDDARRLKITPRKKLLLIHNGIDPYLPFLEKVVAKSYLESKIDQPSEFIVGTIANFYKTKGLEYLIRSCVNLPPKTSCVIIGDGHLRESLKLQVKSLKLQDKVFLIGRVPDAWQHLTAFDVFILPSVKEGFPWTVLEAMAAKIPVVATSVGAIPEVIANGENGFIVKPRSPSEITSAVRQLLNDDVLRLKMGIQGHQTVIQKFNSHQMIERYERLFKDIAVFNDGQK